MTPNIHADLYIDGQIAHPGIGPSFPFIRIETDRFHMHGNIGPGEKDDAGRATAVFHLHASCQDGVAGLTEIQGKRFAFKVDQNHDLVEESWQGVWEHNPTDEDGYTCGYRLEPIPESAMAEIKQAIWETFRQWLDDNIAEVAPKIVEAHRIGADHYAKRSAWYSDTAPLFRIMEIKYQQEAERLRQMGNSFGKLTFWQVKQPNDDEEPGQAPGI